MEIPRVVRPKSLREALGVAFVHRNRTRWRAGTSPLLGLDYSDPDAADTFVVDVADVPDFREISVERENVRIGAFADLDRARAEPLIASTLGATSLTADVACFRLSALGARLVIAGVGATRTASLADVLGAGATRPLAPNEIPLAVELRERDPMLTFGDRRIHRRDGKASFDLRIYAALTVHGHKITGATVSYALDGGELQPLPAVDASLRGAQIARSTFASAARHAADGFHGDDVRSSTLRRTIIPLVLSTLNEAYAAARAQQAKEPPRGARSSGDARRGARRKG